MTMITSQIGPDGPIVPLTIAVSDPRAQALTAAGVQVPTPVAARGLLDTGASCSAVDSRIVQALNLTPTGTVAILTPSTGSLPHTCNQYDVSILLRVSPSQTHLVSLVVRVIEASFGGQAIDVLIGRDVLALGLVVYNGAAANVTLAF